MATRRPSIGFQFVLNSADDSISRLFFGSQTTDIPVAGTLSTKLSLIETNQTEGDQNVKEVDDLNALERNTTHGLVETAEY